MSESSAHTFASSAVTSFSRPAVVFDLAMIAGTFRLLHARELASVLLKVLERNKLIVRSTRSKPIAPCDDGQISHLQGSVPHQRGQMLFCRIDELTWGA